MKYAEACAALQEAARLGSRPGLQNITRLCALLGNPQDRLRIVHVAGTNGKGSTCLMLARMGHAAGYKTGLFASPFFEDYRESISMDGKAISKTEFAKTVQDVNAAARIMEKEGSPPTEYEMLTACAFLWFRRQGCDFVVLETCMGGRLDVTNVVKKPLACVICAIGLDHTAFLGDTVLAIAAEKCGIIKPGSPVVAYPGQPPGALELIRKTALEKGCPFILPRTDRIKITESSLMGTAFIYGDAGYRVKMPGGHQVLNAVTAIETARALDGQPGLCVPEDAIRQGLKEARLPARQEVYSTDPLVILDGAHNPQGIRALAGTLENHLQGKRIIMVMGMLADKQYAASIAVMARLSSRFIATTPENPRALDADSAAAEARHYCRDVSVQPRIGDALAEAFDTCGADGAILVCGSLYVALAARRILEDKNKLHMQI